MPVLEQNYCLQPNCLDLGDPYQGAVEKLNALSELCELMETTLDTLPLQFWVLPAVTGCPGDCM